ncbi:unnamed protein product [Ectocarpus sp. 6 AP-2014]
MLIRKPNQVFVQPLPLGMGCYKDSSRLISLPHQYISQTALVSDDSIRTASSTFSSLQIPVHAYAARIHTQEPSRPFQPKRKKIWPRATQRKIVKTSCLPNPASVR